MVIGEAPGLDSGRQLCFYAFMRTTVDLPTDLLRQAKARAGGRGESLKELFTRAVQLELGQGGLQALPSSSRVQLPLFGDPEGPAVRLTGADVASFLAASDAAEFEHRSRRRRSG